MIRIQTVILCFCKRLVGWVRDTSPSFQFSKHFYLLLAVGLSQPVNSETFGDSIAGAPLADFRNRELVIPCVLVRNLNKQNDGKYYDVILDQTGEAFTYRLRFARLEDAGLCQLTGRFLEFEDQDFESAATKILVICEQRPNRSRISVQGRNLSPGQYSATITSGGLSAFSTPLIQDVSDDVEFRFDSDFNRVNQGITLIAFDFIQDGRISAEITEVNVGPVATITNVECL